MDIPGDSLLAILGAVPFETSPLVDLLQGVGSFDLLDTTFHRGSYHGRSVIVGSTGLGKVNAAVTTAALLERFPVNMLWSVGCAGAFEEGPLHVGDVLVALGAICGDEGVLTRNQILSTSHIGIPILVVGENKYYDRIPLNGQSIMQKIMKATPEGWYGLGGPHRLAERVGPEDNSSALFRLRYGPSLTVGMASGDMEVARNRFLRYGAYAENMEGSGVAQACFRYGIPMVECRGISNAAGDRNKAHWRLDDAMSHCHGVILSWLQSLAPPD
jgi:futalosine hydrolase